MTDHIENHILIGYQLIKKVGTGAYGHVWKVIDKKNGQTFALKKIFDAFQHSTDAQRTYREIMFLHQFNHQNIIKLQKVIKADNDKDLYLVFQFMQADLNNAIGQKILKDVHNRFILYQIIKGIKYLHSAMVIHRDLKPSNILINSDCQIKICDFGLARSLISDKVDKDVILTEEVATRWYRAPQVLLGSKKYGQSADVWSVGCILAEMLIGKPFFTGNSTLSQLERILFFTGNPSQKDIQSLQADCAQTMIKSLNIPKPRSVKQWFKSDTPIEAIDLIFKMLQFNPQKRIKIDDILCHSYISQFRDIKSEIYNKKAITPPVSDNTKLNLKQYRNLIYQSINQIYKIPHQKAIPIEKKSSLNLIERQKITKKSIKQFRPFEQQTLDYSSTHKGFYKSIQRSNSKTTNLAHNTHLAHNTLKKIISHSISQNNFFQREQTFKENEIIKRKSSLKDLLQKKKSMMKEEKGPAFYSSIDNRLVYHPMNYPAADNLLQQYKYYKNVSSTDKGKKQKA